MDSELDLLLKQRKLLDELLDLNLKNIKKHITTWQGFAQAGMEVHAVIALREECFKRGESISVSDARSRVREFVASL